MKQYFAVGTYTEPILFGTGEVFQGKGKGISICELENGNVRVLKEIAVKNPSFLCIDEEKQKIYAVNETKEYQGRFGGGVTQLVYDLTGEMRIEKTCCTGGTDPCHIVIAPNKMFLSVANFASGAVTVISLDKDGNIEEPCRLFQHEGHGTHPVRQKGPHAHSTVFYPDCSKMLVPDLGLDKIVEYSYDKEKVVLQKENSVSVPNGSGPRFGEFGKAGRDFYLINEIGSEVMHFKYAGGCLEYCDTIGTLPTGFHGENICSDLHITPDGTYLYASNRGDDSLVCFQIEEDGSLTFIERQPCGGKTPRNFAIDPSGRYVLVGNQDSDNITVFKTAGQGHLEQVNQFYFGSPVCIRFFERTEFQRGL